MQQLYIGATLQNGKYRIVRVLGQGGFGITYLASYANTLVAIKEFFPESLCCRKSNNCVDTLSITHAPLVAKFKKKFIKEANRIKGLNHPNIIQGYEAFEENGTAYYVMEYVEGYNLNEFVSQHGSYSMESANDIIKQIGSALTYIHQQRMTHLDVKPANILWSTRKNRPILIDFGISKQYDLSGEATSTTPVGFSKGYAPIEQYAQGGVDEFSPQTDVYSLAATYYYLLTGTNPPDATEVLMSGLSNPGGKVSNCFSAIKKAMSPKKAERYSSVNQFLDALMPNKTVLQTEIPRKRDDFHQSVKNPSNNQSKIDLAAQETLYKQQANELRTSLQGGCFTHLMGLVIPAGILFLFMIILINLRPSHPTTGFIIFFLLAPIAVSLLCFWAMTKIAYNRYIKKEEQWKAEHPNDPRAKYL